MRVRAQLAMLAGLLVLSACAASSQAGGPARDRNRITAAEMEAVNARTAMDAVRRLRSSWLRGVGGARPVVYVDNIRMGGLEVLERMAVEDISELRFMSGPDATTRYGTGHMGGAILVSAKR